MNRTYRASARSSALHPANCATKVAAMASSVLVFALLAPVHAAGQAPSLTVHGQEVIRLAKKPQNERVYDLAFSPKRDSAVCAFALEQSVQVWDLSTKPRIVTTLTPLLPVNMSREHETLRPHAIAFSSDGARLAMGYFGMQIWDFSQRKALFVVPLLWFPEAVMFSAMDSTLFVGCSYQGFLNGTGKLPEKIEVLRRSEYERMPVTDPENFESDWSILLHERTGARPHVGTDIFCLTIYPDGKRFVAGGGPVFTNFPRDYPRTSALTVWDVATGRHLFNIGAKESPIVRFCLSPNGNTLYSCGDKVLAWDAMKSAPPTQKFDTPDVRMTSIAISSNGAMLAAGAVDGTVAIWHVESAKRLATLIHGAGAVYGLAFSEFSGKLVAAGEGGLATVWNVELVSKK